MVIYETDTDRTLVWNASAWVAPNSTTANPPGLELVKTQTIGTGVSTVTVSNVFSSSYANYKIVVSDGVASGNTTLRLTLGSTTTGYAYVIIYGNNSTASGNALYIGAQSDASWLYAGYGTVNTLSMNVDLLAPFAAKRTVINAGYVETVVPASAGIFNGLLNNNTSYTAFTITGNTGTFTGGTIRVYGYRN
jgi:hypothetical protein